MGRDVFRAGGYNAGGGKHQIAAIRGISVGCISLHGSPVNGAFRLETWADRVRTRGLPRDVAYGIFPPRTGLRIPRRAPISEKLSSISNHSP